MMDSLVHYDFYLFHLINEVWTHPYLDMFLSFMRNPNVWVPLYVFMISFLLFNFGKKGGVFILVLIATILFSNLISSELIKKNVRRLRPCNESTLVNHRRLLVACGTGYSFTSSHATNHFCMASFIFLTGSAFIGRWRYVFLIWAAVISYAQVYVGVHFPIDVLSGCIVGCLAGWMGSFIYNRYFSLA